MTLPRWLTHKGELSYPALLLWIWLYFLVRAVFYASVIPIWEGYDEWSHFAYIEHVVAHSELPTAATTRVSREIERSMRLVPLPSAAKDSTSKNMRHDEYWNAPDKKRLLLRDALHSIPPDWRAQQDLNGRLLYEAQQPPLYYLLMSIPLRAARNATLVERVYLVRYLSVAVASLLIPIGFLGKFFHCGPRISRPYYLRGERSFSDLRLVRVRTGRSGMYSNDDRVDIPWARKFGKHIMSGIIAVFVLLDFYGMHFLMIPYYSGIIEHTPAGALQTLHVGQLWETGLGPIAERIAANKPALLTPAVLIALWLSYLICTLRLPFSHRRPYL